MKHDIPFFWIIVHQQPIVISIIILSCNFHSISFPSNWIEIRLSFTCWTSSLFVIIAKLKLVPSHVVPWVKVISTQSSCWKIIMNLQFWIALTTKLPLQFIKCGNRGWCIKFQFFLYTSWINYFIDDFNGSLL